MCMKGETFAMKYNEKSFKLEEITNCNFIFLIGRRHNKKSCRSKTSPLPKILCSIYAPIKFFGTIGTIYVRFFAKILIND